MTDPGDTIARRERTGNGALIVSTITIAEIRGDLLIVLHGGARNGDDWGPTSPIPMRRSEWEAIADRSWTRIPAPRWWGDRRPPIDWSRLMDLAHDHDLRIMVDAARSMPPRRPGSPE